MECDEDQGIGDSNKSFNSVEAIAKEAQTVYNQLKMLHFTLKGNHDGDSGEFSNIKQQNVWIWFQFIRKTLYWTFLSFFLYFLKFYNCNTQNDIRFFLSIG